MASAEEVQSREEIRGGEIAWIVAYGIAVVAGNIVGFTVVFLLWAVARALPHAKPSTAPFQLGVATAFTVAAVIYALILAWALQLVDATGLTQNEHLAIQITHAAALVITIIVAWLGYFRKLPLLTAIAVTLAWAAPFAAFRLLAALD